MSNLEEDVDGLLDTDLTGDIETSLENPEDVSSNGIGDGESAMPETESDDPELDAIKARVREMEEEQLKLKAMQEEVEKQLMAGGGSPGMATKFPSQEEKLEADARSVYVGSVDYSATAEELEQHFNGCGAINRVTILCDKFTGHPKGFAYIEFNDKDSIDTAAALNDSLFKGRAIKVIAKRFNVPGVSSTNRGGRRGRAGFRGYSRPYGGGGYRPTFRGRGGGGGGYRPRRPWYTPY
jgi:polyadenylate-binding protein 2